MPLDLEKIDLGGFGIGDTLPEQDTQVRANMGEALKINPDEHAKTTDLSQQSGVPAFAVQSDPAQVEHKLKLDSIDFTEMSKRSPNTAAYLTDFNNSIIAQDDIDVMQSLEDAVTTVTDYGSDIATAFEKGQLQVESSEIGLNRMYQALGANEIVSDEQIARVTEIEELMKPEGEEYGFLTGAPIAAAQQVPIMYEILRTGLGYAAGGAVTGGAVGAGVGALAGGVGAIPGAIAGAVPTAKIGGRVGVAKAAFDLEAGLAFNEFSALQDEAGNLLNPQIAGGAAAMVGAVNAGLEFISLAALGRTVTPVMRAVIRSKVKKSLATETGREMLQRLMRDYGIAVGTEAVTESAQEFTNVIGGELAKYIDEDSFTEQDLSSALDNIFSGETAERVAEAGKVGAQAALIFAGAGTTASVITESRQRERLSSSEQLRIDSVNDLSAQSKLRERDKESFRQFVEQADGESNTHVFIDGAQTSLYLQDKTAEEIEADPALKLLSEQVREAAALGVDVQAPVADFAADIAGTEHFTALRDSMTMRDETTSPFRQEQAQQETETYVRVLMEEAQESASEYVEAQEIYTSVRDQLIDSGQVTPANASVMAQVVPAWATAQARRSGKTVQQVYEDSGLIIEGPQTGERARLEGEQVLEQRQRVESFAEITREEFLGEPSIVSPRGAAQLIPRDLNEGQSSESFLEGKYRLVIAESGAAVYDGDKVVASYNLGRNLVVDKKYRRKGIAEELVYQWRTRFPGPAKADDRTKASQKIQEKVWDRIQRELEEPIADVEQRATLLEQPGVIDEDARQELERDRERRKARQAAIEEAKARTDEEALAEFNRAKAGETVTFVRRSRSDFPTFDDTKIGAGTDTPSAFLGHYLGAADVGNAPKYGNEVSVWEFTPKNPLVIEQDTFEAATTGDMTAEQMAEHRQSFIDEGHDAILVKDLNWVILLEGATAIKQQEDVELLLEPELFEQRDDKQPEARGYYDPANSIIRLTEAADLSTFLHEFAHFMYEMEVNGDTEMLQSINNWYKRNAEDVAREATSYVDGEFDVLKQGDRTDKEPVTITPEDVVTYLDNKTTGDKDKDNAIRRAVHEQFARGFETYLMEGKAPSVELRNAFRTFARWLSRIYQGLRGQLRVDLDAEMREVFDRLLATEDQIAAAEARTRAAPMFTDAAMAGMTEEEFAKYQKQQEKVKDVQSETLRDKIIKQLTRQTKAWWKEEKQDIIDEEIDTLKGERVYAARERLRTGDIKLDHATVKEMAGEEKTNKLGHKRKVIPPELSHMTAKGMKGIHPDEAAAFFGYGSGSEMLNDLVTAPDIDTKAKVNAEARMVERHGDILTDGTIEREADEAVQNEERGKLILSELKALAKGTNAPAIDRATIKAVAETNIGKLSFRQIHPGKYRKAEIRAAQESARMLAEGNKEGAAAAKMRQVMNYYLGMAATDAKNDTTKIIDNMSRYNKKKVREEIMKAEGGYWDQITRILDRFEFRKSATLKEVESLNTWMKERMETDGDGLVLSNVVLNESYVTHWKNVPFSDLQGINDSVKNIEHVARYANKIRLADKEIEFKKLKNQWVDHIKQQDQRFDTKASRSRLDDSRKATTMEHIRKWASQLTKVPFLASWLDGGERAGFSHDILVQQFTDALDAKMKLMDEVFTPVVALIRGRDKADRKRHNTKVWIPEINDHLEGHQIVAVALNTGNQGNLKKLLLGEGWADPENAADISFDNSKLQAVLAHMTKSDWEMVQKIWDQMDALYPQLAEVHRRTTGETPPKVEATPVTFNVIDSDTGKVVQMTVKGGYYPVKYSPKRSHKAEKNAEKREAETESMFNNTASIQSSVNTGATNERTGFYDRIYLSLEVVPDHFNETIHYITHHDAVRQVNRLIQSPDVADAITGVLGEEEFKQLKPWLNDVAKDGRQQPVKTYIDESFHRLRFGTTLGVMGFKASTGIMQLFGILTTAAELGVGPTVKGVQTTIGRSWYMKAVRNLLGSRDDMQTGWEFAVERSKVMAHRTDTMDREIRNAMDRLRGKTGFIAATQEVSMKHIALIQTYMVDLPTWHAAYDKELSESGDEAKAVKRADWSVENLQGSGATKDMATIVRSQSKIHTTFTMFMTFFSSLGNLSVDLVKGSKSGLYSPTSVAAKAMFLYSLPVFLEMLMRGDLDEPEDEDDRMSKLLTGVALYPLASVPFVRDVAGGLIGEYGYNVSPVSSVIEKGISGFKQIGERVLTDDEITKGAAKGASKLAAAAAGIPGVNQAWSTGEHLYDVIEEGEDFTVRELIFGPKRD